VIQERRVPNRRRVSLPLLYRSVGHEAFDITRDEVYQHHNCLKHKCYC